MGLIVAVSVATPYAALATPSFEHRILVALAKKKAAEREILRDRCSAEVSFGYRHPTAEPGTIVLKRGKSRWTPWTEPFRPSRLPGSQIRWWCHNDRHNPFDFGVYLRPSAAGGLVGKYSVVDGWTPERSACRNRRSRIRARLGPNRQLQIECLDR